MYQPYSSTGQPAKLMYGGAALSAACLIATMPFMGGIHGKVLGHRLTATPLTIAAVIVVFGLVPVALWLWMARAASQGKDRARILVTVLFTLATLQLIESQGIVQVFTVALTWLIGLAAMWLLWRPEGYGHE